MAAEVVMPALGMAQETGVLVGWLKAEGEAVTAGEPLMEIETDKAMVEVEAPASGTLGGILARPGDEVPVGQVIAYILAPGETPPTARPAVVPPAGTATPAHRPAPAAAPARAVVPRAAAEPSPQPATLAPGTRPPAARPAASPKARRLAREQGLALEGIAGSGPAGAVLAADLLAAAAGQPGAGPVAGAVSVSPEAGAPLPLEPSAPALLPAPPLPDFAQWGTVRRQALSTVRRVIAQRMQLSWTTIPQVTHFDRADVTELERWRRAYATGGTGGGGRVPMTAVVVKVAAAAIRRFPLFGASVDAARLEVVYKDYVHIGVAVDTERGLLVPVIRDADRKNVLQIAGELGELAQRAR
ncbi:MAG: 2-oxo acid dehydrogenase subunit E2, partial [Candidatus Latescibacterota bacterium]